MTGWSGTTHKKHLLLNEERRKLLYSWLVGSEDDNGQRQPPKIADPEEIRKLPQLMADEIQFKRFCENPALGLDEASAGAVTPKPAIQWQVFLRSNLNVLTVIPATDLEEATPKESDLLKRVRDLAAKHLKIIESARPRPNHVAS